MLGRLKNLINLQSIMNLENLTYNIPVLSTTSKVTEIESFFLEEQTDHVVIVDDERFVGLISKEILNHTKDKSIIDELINHFKIIYLSDDFTLFDWLKLKVQFNLKTIPLIDRHNMKFLGMLNEQDIIAYLSDSGLLVDLSSVLILRKETQDFKYSEVFQIAEANGAKVFGSYLESISSEYTDIVLNIQHSGLNELLQSYRRYQYDIISYHDEDMHQDTLKANSDYFSKYLTV